MAASISFFILSIVLLLGAASPATGDSHETSVHFSYFGITGPNDWGHLSPSFSPCSNGKLQSPINILKNETVVNENLKPLIKDYHPANATLVNHDIHIGMHYEGNAGVLTVEGKNYTLKKMHWHSPSEHRIDGIQYPAELHMVHIADDGSISAVSILYQYGNPDPLLSKIKESLDQLAKEVCAGDEEAHIPVGIFYAKHMKKKSRKYYRYIGSLTTPPCTEKVIWSVLGKVRSISREQVASLKAPLDPVYKNNSRPMQLMNGRHIELYDELNGVISSN